jgi:hypothetical protein
MSRAHASVVALLVVGLCAGGCDRSRGGIVSDDAALQGPRTLGFVELRGAIPTPSSPGGGAVAWASEEADGGLASMPGPAPVSDDAAAAPDAVAPSAVESTAPVAEERPRPWSVQALPAVLARAIDARGHRVALTEDSVVDESARGARSALVFDDARCDAPLDALSFDEADAGYVVRAGRVFVRRPDAREWVATNVCTDIAGEPWSFEPSRGWSVIAHRSRGATPAVMVTRDRTGRYNWTVVSAAGERVGAAALDPDGSRLVLEHGGHPLMIDVTREVAGAVLATASVEFEGVTRTKNGVIVWRQSEGDVDLLVSRLARGSYRRERVARDAGTETVRVLGVWAGALGQRVAITTRGVELFEAGRAHGREVARWPAVLNSAHGINVGWLADGRLAAVTPSAWARED